MSRRVLHLIDRLAGYGNDAALRELARDQATSGDRVVIGAGRVQPWAADEAAARGIAVAWLGQRWHIDPWAAAKAARLVRRDWDCIHAWGLAAAAASRWLVPSRHAARRLVSLASPLPLRGAGALLAVRACRDAAALAWLDEDAAAWGVAHGIGPDVVAVQQPIPRAAAPAPDARTGVAPDAGPSPASPQHAWLAPGTRRIVTAGPLVRRRRLDEAIWAYELIRLLVPEVRLLIAGEGPDRQRLERFAASVGKPGGVYFTGDRRDWREWLGQCDIYWELGPSRQLPQSLLEAQRQAVPSVCVDVPSHRQAIEHRQNGLLCRLGDRADAVRQTLAVLERPQLADRLAEGAALRSDCYPFRAVREAWRRLYDPIP